MSRDNIISMEPDPEHGELIVTFQCRDGNTRSCAYSGPAAIAISGGDDPARYEGEQTDGPHGNLIASIGQEVEATEEGIGEAVGEVAEITTGLL